VIQAIAVTAELTGTQLSKAAAEVFAADLAEHPAEAVLVALDRCRKEIRGRLTLADVIARIRENDGRPGIEEAWAMLPRTEAESAVLTDEMATAMGAAAPLLAEGDAIAARMAFKEVYSREVTAARAAGKPVRWFASMGHDTAGREAVVRQAVALGRLSREQAVKHLPHLDDAPMDPNGRKQLAAIKSLLLPKLSPEVRSEAA
jgi:predicted ester cyclase